MPLGTMGPVRLPRDQQPHPGPLRYGLFNVAPPKQIISPPEDPHLEEHAFGGGLYYDPYGCGQARPYDVACVGLGSKTFDPNSPEIAVLPFVVYTTMICGPRGITEAYMTTKTANRLYSSEQHAVEAALMHGTGGARPWIADPAGPYAAPVDVGGGGLTFPTVVDAVAALERHAYTTVPYGHHAVLHANPSVHAYAAEAHLVATAAEFGPVWGAVSPLVTPESAPGDVPRTEPVLRTPLGTKWVFGAGYSGAGPNNLAPAAGKTYIWITGHVSVWRSAKWSPPSIFQTMDRELNQLKALAERPYLVTFDCFRAFALVDIPNPAV